jgi:hypothetical protein
LKLIPVGVEPSFALHGLARLRQDTQGYAGIRGTTQPAVDTKNAESRPVARSAYSRAFQRSVLLSLQWGRAGLEDQHGKSPQHRPEPFTAKRSTASL